MKLVLISDTHLQTALHQIPDGDMLIHSGDALLRGTREELQRFIIWMKQLPHKYKIFVAGNHDRIFESSSSSAYGRLLADIGVTYLQDEIANIENIKIYGSPWQPAFYNWAFNLPRGGKELKSKWEAIPEDVDLLVTHCPPGGILDAVPHYDRTDHIGCNHLRNRVDIVKPKLHVFGHCHAGYGQEKRGDTLFVNTSICNEEYVPMNKAVVIEWESL